MSLFINATRATVRSTSVQARSLSYLSDVAMGPPDAILGLTEQFNKDSDPRKTNLGVGAYRDDSGKPYVLPSVRKAEKHILEMGMNHEYAGIVGVPDFVKSSIGFVYGEDAKVLSEKRVAAVQSISGTGACSLAANFYKKFAPAGTRIYQPDPTWGNHVPIFKVAGMEVHQYRYLNRKDQSLDLQGMLQSIDEAPNASVFLLHACAHNPTGVDPNIGEWKQISDAIKAKNHIVFFDSAYQGFATGNPDTDAAAIRLFVDEGHTIGLAQSYAKNFGLYGQRIGCFSMVGRDEDEAQRIESQLKILVRPQYSNPPIHGARIVSTILGDPARKAEWFEECKGMANRIISMRALLKSNLEAAGSKHDWKHVTNQIGMFCYSGMTEEQVLKIRSDRHIYLTNDGRISMAGVTSGNVGYLAESMHEVTK